MPADDEERYLWAQHDRTHDQDRENAKEQRAQHQAQHEQERQARAIAEQRMGERLEGMNEFRASLRDAQSTYLTRTEYDARHDALVSDIRSMQKQIDLWSGSRQGFGASWKVIAGTIGAVAALLTIVTMIIVFTR
jgi:hypothetical protein